MKSTSLQSLRASLLIAAAGLAAGCADDASMGPDQSIARTAELAASSPPSFAPTSALAASPRSPDLGSCQNLQAPAGSKLALRVYAEGVQIYHWNGTSWSFDGPSAALTADAGGNGVIGTHYAGPTWESVSGSKVVGAVLERCTVDPNSVPWLLLGAVSAEGAGIFDRVTFIQRLNTVGGNAPSNPGSSIGEEARVPYTTEYLFYRAK